MTSHDRSCGGTKILSVCAIALFVATAASAGEKDEVSLEKISKRNDLSGLPDKLARLTFVYKGDNAPAQHIRSHHCVVGDWEYASETNTHWIGLLMYPSNNYEKGSALIAMEAKIAKSAAVKVDMKTWKGRLLLENTQPKPSADKREAKPTELKVIGYERDGKFLRDGILDLYDLLPFAKEK